MLYIIDNVTTPSVANKLEQEIVPSLFYAYLKKTILVPSTVKMYSDEHTYDNGQLTCPIYYDGNKSYPCSHHLPILEIVLLSCLDKIGMTLIDIARIKINLLTKQNFPEYHYNIPHIDSKSGLSLIYYITDSDGDTFIFNEGSSYRENKIPDKLTIAKRITPKKNRAVLFNSNIMHASSNPIINDERYVVNFMFNAK